MPDTNAVTDVAAGLGMLAGVFVVVAIVLVPLVFYCLTIQKALNRCSPECRAMTPSNVWLLFIPGLNFVWHFFVVMNLAKSLGAEFQKRGIAGEPNPGQTIGTAMCILFCCCLVPLLNLLCAPAYLVCWILYWVKIAGYSRKIAAPPVPVAV